MLQNGILGLFRGNKQAAAYKHTIVIGAGEVGFHVAQRLVAEQRRVTVIDTRPEALKRMTEALDVQVVLGSGCSPAVLNTAEASKADLILAVTDSDEDNLISCFFAAQAAPAATRLARIRNEEYTAYFAKNKSTHFNINMLINPAVELVSALSRIVSFPGAVEFSEFADKRLKLIGIRMQNGPLLGRPLTNFNVIMDEPNVRVAAIIRNEKLIIPSGSDTLEVGDIAYFACTEDAVQAVRSAATLGSGMTHNVFIIGGGDAGLRLAQDLEAKNYHIKILEKDAERCNYLANILNRTVVLHGNGTSQEVLKEENIGDMDAVIGLTGNEETNVLVCLLAKSLGAERTITRVNNAAYLPLARALGIDHCVSPRLAAVNSIIKHLRRGQVLSAIPIKDDEAEAIEMLVPEGSRITEHSVAEASLPKGVSILAVLRGQALFIPRGDSVILPGDRITVFAERQSLPAVESLLEPCKNEIG